MWLRLKFSEAVPLGKKGNTCRSVPVSLLNIDRKVLKIFPSIKMAAIYLGASKTTVRKYITSGEVFKGQYYIVRKRLVIANY